jgi:ubiquinone/menaquinone biosynthesis C-methylase UbiE
MSEKRSLLDGFEEPLFELALRDIHGSGEEPALDLGCGRGRNTGMLLKRRLQPVGADINEEALASARRRYPNVEFTRCDMQKLPYKDGQFNVVFSFSTFQYVNWRAVIRECNRVMRPGGIAVFVENLDDNPLVRTYRLIHRLLRWRYNRYEVPRAYLDWAERGEFARVFESVEYTPMHLTTPLALIMPMLWQRMTGREMAVGSNVLRLFQRTDAFLIKKFKLERYCWRIIIRVRKSDRPSCEV